jgi:asparagine synthase (glutamine-hydrolysing)
VADTPAAHHETRELLSRAVARSLSADGTTACFLSGGLDSSSVAGTAAKLRAPKPMQAYSIGFDEPAYDETEFARGRQRSGWLASAPLTADETALTLPGRSRLRSAVRQPRRSPFTTAHAPGERGCRRMLAGDGGDEILLAIALCETTAVRRFAGWPARLRTGAVAR